MTPFNPYPGLRPFRIEEDHLFFGREEQVRNLIAQLDQSRFVAVVGTSGSGKSSLVRCGLLSELQRGTLVEAGSHWEVAVMQPGGDPARNLALSLIEADLYDSEDAEVLPRLLATLSRSRHGLIEATRQSDMEASGNLLLVVDQFEELFRFRNTSRKSADDASNFVRLLLEAINQGEQSIYVVLTMRSDFLGDCSQFSLLAEAVNDGEYLIPRLSRDQTQLAIEGPARVAGGEISWRLVQRLLLDLEDDADRLPIMQHCLMRLWEAWASDHEDDEPMDLRHYDATGGMTAALSQHADEVLLALPEGVDREVAERLFKALTETGEEGRRVRRPQRLSDLVAIGGGDQAVVHRIVEAYRSPGVTLLMPPDTLELAEETVIDISHESLMRVWERLRHWVEEEEQSAGIYRRLAETARLWQADKAGLYHDPDLTIAQGWRTETKPNAAWASLYSGDFQTAMPFLDKSALEARRLQDEEEAARQRELEQALALADSQQLRAEEQRRAAGRMRKGMLAFAGVAGIAVIATFFAFASERRANVEKEIAKTTKETVAGELYVADMNRAAQAYQEGNMKQLEQVMSRHALESENDHRGPEWHYWQQLLHGERAQMVREVGRLERVVVSPDHKTVILDHLIFDVASRNLLGESPLTFNENIAYAPDGATLAGWAKPVDMGNRPVVRRWSSQTWGLIEPDITLPESVEISKTITEHNMPLAYSPDGSLLAAGVGEQIVIWECGSWNALHVISVPNSDDLITNISHLTFSPDGTSLLASATDRMRTTSNLHIWDVKKEAAWPLRTSIVRDRYIETLAYAPDGRFLITGSARGELLIWDGEVPSEKTEKLLFRARDAIVHVGFSRGGEYLAASTKEGNGILVWETASWRLISTLKGQITAMAFAFVGGGAELWACGVDGRAEVLDVHLSGPFTEIDGSETAAGISYLSGGRLAWRERMKDEMNSGQKAGTAVPIQIYDVASKRMTSWNGGQKFKIHAVSTNGQFLAAQGEDLRIQVWNTESGQPMGATPNDLDLDLRSIGFLAVSNDGSRVFWSLVADSWVFGSQTSGLHLWSPMTDRHSTDWSEDYDTLNAVAFSPDSKLIATVGIVGLYRGADPKAKASNVMLKVWDIAGDEPQELFNTGGLQGSPVLAVAFSPDGRHIVAGRWAGEINKYDARPQQAWRGKKRLTMEGHAGFIKSLAFLPDGRLVSAADDRTLRMWDVDRGVSLTKLPSWDVSSNRIVVDPQRQWMVSSSVGQKARLWRFAEVQDQTDKSVAQKTWWNDGLSAGVQGRFAQVREAGRKAVEIAPKQMEGEPWFHLAALAIDKDDLDAFRQIRRDMLGHFGSGRFPTPSAYTAFLCAAMPAEPSELDSGLQLAERVVAQEFKIGRPGNDSISTSGMIGQTSHDLSVVSCAWCEYRKGQFAKAIETLEEVRSSEDYLRSIAIRGEEAIHLCGDLAFVVSQHQLGEKSAALEALSLARQTMSKWDENYPGTVKRESDGRWPIWMIAKALLREAEALIGESQGAR